MWNLIKRWWKYVVTWGHVKHVEHADPVVLLEQAMREAYERDRVLREQAAMVLANQRRAQDQLDKAVAGYDKAKASAGQAILLAEQEARRGNDEKASGFTATAEGFADRMLGFEAEIGEQERMLLAATDAAEKAKASVRENGERLAQQVKEKEQLLDALDRAKMQEAVNAATVQITSAIGTDVPTFAEVRKRIQTREYAAQGQAELISMTETSSLDAQMLEIEKAQRSAAAQAQLATLREQLGLPAPAPERPALLRAVEADDEAVTGEL